MNHKIDLDCNLKEVIGKVFDTDCQISICECGQTVHQRRFAQLREGTNEMVADMYIGFCSCGNVAIAQMPEELSKN